MTRWLVAIVVVITFVLPFSAKAQTTQAVKIGSFDLQKVMMESEKGKEVTKSFEVERDKLKKSLDQKQDELQKLKDSLDRQGATMSPDVKADKEKQYQSKLKDFQRLTNDYQTEFQQKAMDTQNKMFKELEEVIRALGETEKYTLILEKSVAAFAAASIDVTAKIISRYNELNKKTSAPAKK
jgi:outer membrane protein